MPPLGANGRIREAIHSGIMYPDDPAALEDAIDGLLASAEERARRGPAREPDGSVARSDRKPDPPMAPRPSAAIIAPHAALQISGAVQAAAWATAKGARIDRIVILAPYRAMGPPAAYLPEAGAYQTPLGDVRVDTALCDELETYCTLFASSDMPHLEDHSIEVQLPFARRLFPAASIIPILISGDAAVAACMARSIELALEDRLERTLLVASTNLASSMIADDARVRSSQALDLIGAGDWRGVAGRRDINGSTAIATLLATERLKGAEGRLLERLDSRRRESLPNARVVEYAAYCWYGS